MPVSGSHSMAASPPAVRGPHGPGPTSRETSAVPGVKSQFAWVAAMMIAAGTTHLRHIILAPAPIGGALEFGYQTIDPRRSHRRPVLGAPMTSRQHAGCCSCWRRWLTSGPSISSAEGLWDE